MPMLLSPQGTGHIFRAVHNSAALIVEAIRRLVPQECELLQGFPAGWTDLPGASDSARYKALGNSVAGW